MVEEQDITGKNRPQRAENGQLLPGSTANPYGRPKGSYSIVELIKKKLQEIPEGKNKTYGEYFVEQVMKKSITEGDVSMMKDLIDRVDGKALQRMGDKDGKPLAMVTNIVQYGTNDKINVSPQLDAISTPIESITEPSTIQSISVAPESNENHVSNQPANEMGSSA